MTDQSAAGSPAALASREQSTVALNAVAAAVRAADRPADRNHPDGHGKIENISALFETGLLLATVAWIVWESIRRLMDPPVHVEVTLWSFAVMITSIVAWVSVQLGWRSVQALLDASPRGGGVGGMT